MTGLAGFWAAALGLAAAVGALIAMAMLGRRGGEGGDGGGGGQARGLAIYRDQLAEVDRDLARGVLAEEEAGRVRLEISRRLLDADRAAAADGGPAPARLTRVAAAAIFAALVGGTAALYVAIGSPGSGDLPIRERLAAAEETRASRPGQAEMEAAIGAPPAPPPDAGADFLALMERLREAVAERPDDLEGQLLLARNEARLGDFRAAHPAQARAIALMGARAGAEDHAAHAEMLVMAAGGYVSPEAEAALDRALALDPANGAALYFRGLMFAQVGRPDLAFGIWSDLLEESDPRAPWLPAIRGEIDAVARAAGVRYRLPERFAAEASPALPGPTADDVEAAEAMSADERREMAAGMVERLAERLASEGGTPAEWARLVFSLGRLGETARAREILDEARGAFADSPDAVSEIEDAARRAGAIE